MVTLAGAVNCELGAGPVILTVGAPEFNTETLTTDEVVVNATLSVAFAVRA